MTAETLEVRSDKRKQTIEREKKRKERKRERKRERKGEKRREKRYYKSAFNSQKDKLNILAEMLKISKSGRDADL